MSTQQEDYFTSSLPALVARRAAERGDQPFLQVVDGPTRTYADVDRESRRWAGAFARLGVRRGDNVLVMLPSGATSIEVWTGLNWLGAAEASVHNDYRGKMLGHLLRVTEATVMVVGIEFLDRLREIADDLQSLQVVVTVGDGAVEEIDGVVTISADDALGDPPEGLVPPSHHEITTILFTSGTTGTSKGVVMPFAHLQAATQGSWPFEDLTSADAHYTVLPLYHLGGKFAIITMLMTGGRVVLRERFSTRNFWSDIRRYDCSMSSMIGTIANFLHAEERRPDDADTPLSKLLMIPLIDDIDGFRERFGVQVRTCYSQTEISAPIATEGWDVVDPRSCGRLRPGYECRIVDEHDEEVADGELGELVVRADRPWAMMAGYLNMPEKTVEAWRNQWLHTGDALYRDADGNYFFADRLTDTMRRRGENISSMDVESFVNEHPAVVACAAVPVAAAFGEDEIKVVVELQAAAELDHAELLAFLADRMPRFMVPRYIEFVDELPRTPTQKVKKRELRDRGLTPATWDRDAGPVASSG